MQVRIGRTVVAHRFVHLFAHLVVDNCTTSKPRELILSKRPRLDSESQYITKFPELDYFNKDIDCSICFEPFYHPIMLECGHTYCKPCLEQLLCAEDVDLNITDVWANLKGPKANFRIKCPNCRQQSTVSGKMPVLAVLCKQIHPNYYMDRRKRAQKEFDQIVFNLWNQQQPCTCAIS